MDLIRASLDNGVLTVVVPKISEFKSKNAINSSRELYAEAFVAVSYFFPG